MGHVEKPQGGQEAESRSMGKAEARAILKFPREWQSRIDNFRFG